MFHAGGAAFHAEGAEGFHAEGAGDAEGRPASREVRGTACILFWVVLRLRTGVARRDPNKTSAYGATPHPTREALPAANPTAPSAPSA